MFAADFGGRLGGLSRAPHAGVGARRVGCRQNVAAQDDDPRSYIIALRHVAEARGGLAKIASEAGVSRETLYRTLSARGNPAVKTLAAVLKAAGPRMAVHTQSSVSTR